MKIITVYFNRRNKYKKLLIAFRNSLKRSMPDVKLKILKPALGRKYNRKKDITISFLESAYYALKSDEPLIIADVDLLFLKNICGVFKKEFDIAITVREDKKKPYNTGLWYYRPTPAGKEFLENWIKETERLIDEAVKNKKWIFTHGGVDQMSLHAVLGKNKKANILRLPCQVWNACQTEWDFVNEKTRVIHIKSKLRDWALKSKTPREHLRSIKKLGKLWRSFL